MNIQDVINRALADSSDIAISEVRDNPEVMDVEITKLATALNFIGTNLEQSIPSPREVMAQAELTSHFYDEYDEEESKTASLIYASSNEISNYLGYSNRDLRMLTKVASIRRVPLENLLLEKLAFANAEAAVAAIFHPDRASQFDAMSKRAIKKGVLTADQVEQLRALHAKGLDVDQVLAHNEKSNIFNVAKKQQSATEKAVLDAAMQGKSQEEINRIANEAGKAADAAEEASLEQFRNNRISANEAGKAQEAAEAGAGATQKANKATGAATGAATEAATEATETAKDVKKNAPKASFLRRAGEFTGVLDSGKGGLNRAGRLGATVLGTGAAAFGAKKAYDHFKSKDQEKKADAAIATGLLSHHNQKKRMDLENVSARDRAIHGPSALGSVGRAYGYGVGGAAGGGLLGTMGGAALGGMAGGAEGAILGGVAGLGLGSLGGSIYGLKKSTDKNKQYADRAIRAARERRMRKREHSKTASVDNALYQAAQAGMTSLQEKVAEDRINPAKISAGSADAYSGQIMPKSSPVFGGNTTPAQLINMKAQKVRARINSDMKKYVKNVGDGYNAQGHLTKFNK